MTADHRPAQDARARMLAELRAAWRQGASGDEQLAILRKWAPFLDDEAATGHPSQPGAGRPQAGGPAAADD